MDILSLIMTTFSNWKKCSDLTFVCQFASNVHNAVLPDEDVNYINTVCKKHILVPS